VQVDVTTDSKDKSVGRFAVSSAKSTPIYWATDSPQGSDTSNGIFFARDLTVAIIFAADVDVDLEFIFDYEDEREFNLISNVDFEVESEDWLCDDDDNFTLFSNWELSLLFVDAFEIFVLFKVNSLDLLRNLELLDDSNLDSNVIL